MKTSMKKNSGLIKSQMVHLLALLVMMLMAVPTASASGKSGLLTDSLLSSFYKDVKVDVETVVENESETDDLMMAWGPRVIIRPMPRVVRRPMPKVVRGPMPKVVRRPMPRVVRRPLPRVLRTPLPMVIRTPVPF